MRQYRRNAGNKYHNEKFGDFDSRKEEARYGELLLLQRAGKISELRRQVPFELIPAQREPDTKGPRGGVMRGKTIEHAVKYVADFVYYDHEAGRDVVEDVKGVRTPEYILKRKLMLWRYGIRIKEV